MAQLMIITVRFSSFPCVCIYLFSEKQEIAGITFEANGKVNESHTMRYLSGYLRWALPSIDPTLALLFGTIDSLINEHINEISYVIDEHA